MARRKRVSARRPLTRQALVKLAIKLMRDKGVDGVSMRALAEAADVTPMALYNHFEGKSDLLTAIADDLIGGVNFTSADRSWRAQVEHCFAALRSLCLEHPALPRLLEREGVAPTKVFIPIDVASRALKRAGLDEADAMRAVFLLITYTIGQANYQATGPMPQLDPSVRSGKAEAWNFDESFDFGIAVVLAGVERIAARKSPRSRRARAKRGG